jgi:hypothetical protein
MLGFYTEEPSEDDLEIPDYQEWGCCCFPLGAAPPDATQNEPLVNLCCGYVPMVCALKIIFVVYCSVAISTLFESVLKGVQIIQAGTES